MKKIVPLIMLIAAVLTACGGKPTQPAVNPADVQASAVAMAFTFAAQTQAAVPTATVAPPTGTATFTPLASPTTFSFPTFPVAQHTATTIAGADPCNGPMAPEPGGPKINLGVQNKTKAKVTLSMWLKPTPFSCGFVNLVVGARDSVTSYNVMPEGCWWPSVYITDPVTPRALSGFYGPGNVNGYMCMHTLDRTTLIIDYEGFDVVWP